MRRVAQNIITWKERLRQKMAERGLSMKALSLAAGFGETFVRDILERGRTPSDEKLKALAEQLGTTASFLLDGPADDEDRWHSVAVMGFIGAGAEIQPDFEQVPPEGLFTVELPFAVPPEMIGLEVKGSSMLPRYDDGDVIVVWREQRRPTDAFLGEECAVRTGDNMRFLKRPMRGPTHGRFNLESWNARTIEDVEIVWVGEIYVTVRSGQLRRIEAAQKAGETKRDRARRAAGTNELF